MNILVIVNSLAHGGAEKIASIQSLYLSKEHDVVIFLLENDIKYETPPGVEIIRPKNKTLLEMFHTVWKLFSIMKRKNFDLAISHMYKSNYLNSLIGLATKTDTIIVTHGSILKYNNYKIASMLNKFLIFSTFRCAKHRVFLTKRMKDDFSKVIPKRNNYIITNGYDLSEISVKSDMTIPTVNYQNYFVFVGRLHSVKRIKDIIEVFSCLDETILIIGSGPEENELIKMASNFENIHFLGAKSNPFPYIKNAKATILASQTEGFPNTIIESLVLSTPMISSDCRTGPREILGFESERISELGGYIKNDVGIIFNVGDVLGLKKAIKDFDSLYFDSDQMKKIAMEYDVAKVSEKYLEMNK